MAKDRRTNLKELLDQQPPSDVDAEKQVLGAAVVDVLAADYVCEHLQSRYFYDPANRIIFEHIHGLRRDDKPTDIGLLIASLKGAAGNDVAAYEEIGGASYIASLADHAVTAAHAQYYCDIVRDAAHKRDAREAHIAGIQATDNGKPANTVIADSIGTLQEIAERAAGAGVRFARISSTDLATQSYKLDYLIDDTLVAGQPCIIAGPKKALKTSIIVDMAVSLASGHPFLGRFTVTPPGSIVVMSGESGLATIQETAMRVSDAKGCKLSDLANLTWSNELPQFGNFEHMDELGRMLKREAASVLFVDPAYLAMPGGDAGNLFIQGELLRNASRVCERNGVTLILAHHTRKQGKGDSDRFRAPDLDDLAWSGFAEFARQWLLIGRRQDYEDGSGEHALWIRVGGSAGHSALWAVDVNEGTRNGQTTRHWDVEVSSASEAIDSAKANKERQRREKKEAKLRSAKADIVKAMRSLPEGRGTKTDIKERSGLNTQTFSHLWGELLCHQEVMADGKIIKGNKQQYDAFILRNK